MDRFSSNKPYLVRALYQWILDNNGTPHLVVNADFPQVQVPREYVNNGEIVLNVSPHSVQGLELENHMISFNARFGGQARVIRIPIGALLAIVARENGEGMAFTSEEIFDENVETPDQEIRRDFSEETSNIEGVEERRDNIKSHRPNLKSKSSKKNGHLKIVK